MNNYTTYDIIPNGIIVFESKKVHYINQHLLDVFNIGLFSMKNSVEIIMKTLQIEGEDELFHFFSNHNYFTHKNKIIQIEHNKYDNSDIFSFMLIKSELLKDDVFVDYSKEKTVNIDAKIAEHFKLKNIKKVGILTFYKGLPLKNIGHIIRINSDSIEVKVDPKHNISLQKSNDILIIVNKSKSASAIRGYVDKSINNIFSIKNFILTKNDMHLRNDIRIKPESDIFISHNNKEYEIYDLSENGVSIHVNNEDDEKSLKEKKSLDLIFHNKTIHINTEYLKTVYAENGDMLKIILNMYNSSDTAAFIKSYLMKRQNEIIKEIHHYLKEKM